MKKIKYPIASPTWNNKEIKALHNVIDAGKFTMGDRVKKYEEEFANYIGSKYAIMVNSGSSANLLMIAALFFTIKPKLKPGDEIIVPAVSWSTTYSPLQQYGLKLKFVDIDINTLNIDLEMIEKKITKKTKMIFTVNLLGNSNNFNALESIINNKNIFFIEDNCESLGATFNNKKAGSFGLMGSFSSFFSHHISTMEGGIVVTDNDELYQIMLSMRAHGWTRNLPAENLLIGNKNKDIFKEEFNFILPGYNLRPLELEGALGIEQLKKLPKLIKNRRLNAKKFKDLFFDDENIIIQQEIGKSSWFGFSMVFKNELENKRKFLSDIFRKNGIEHRPIVAGNFTKNIVLKYYDYEIPFDLVNADSIHDNGLFFGNHHFNIDAELTFLRNLINSII